MMFYELYLLEIKAEIISWLMESAAIFINDRFFVILKQKWQILTSSSL